MNVSQRFVNDVIKNSSYRLYDPDMNACLDKKSYIELIPPPEFRKAFGTILLEKNFLTVFVVVNSLTSEFYLCRWKSKIYTTLYKIIKNITDENTQQDVYNVEISNIRFDYLKEILESEIPDIYFRTKQGNLKRIHMNIKKYETCRPQTTITFIVDDVLIPVFIEKPSSSIAFIDDIDKLLSKIFSFNKITLDYTHARFSYNKPIIKFKHYTYRENLRTSFKTSSIDVEKAISYVINHLNDVNVSYPYGYEQVVTHRQHVFDYIKTNKIKDDTKIETKLECTTGKDIIQYFVNSLPIGSIKKEKVIYRFGTYCYDEKLITVFIKNESASHSSNLSLEFNPNKIVESYNKAINAFLGIDFFKNKSSN